ncbi:hypothetical protein Bpfe_015323 [Biomphalaria pfeifferi]|uniref:Uncharacterized protein n=1 Tax=Biomphalaria pfeifferi TaxID=112525 RepID=A0AAD8F9S9_BIOPF|nr:hypothetical protein Bpfe_015323 [Biomphalaria pfeifferi]
MFTHDPLRSRGVKMGLEAWEGFESYSTVKSAVCVGDGPSVSAMGFLGSLVTHELCSNVNAKNLEIEIGEYLWRPRAKSFGECQG